jgi:hypothetical protein
MDSSVSLKRGNLMALGKWTLSGFITLATVLVYSGISPKIPGTQRPQKSDDTSALIDNLKNVCDGDIGYLSTSSGSGFLPLGVSVPDTLHLDQKLPVTSHTLRELVSRGAKAVPELIAHLNDARLTKINITHESIIGGIHFSNEYDFNRRTNNSDKGMRGGLFPDPSNNTRYTVTVGDLCFVALGQILNRDFEAVRYQPTAFVIINSPTTSRSLRKVIKEEWGGITPAQHKESLVRDFLKPDHEYRRIGACLRLGFYYPEAIERLALKQLAEPRYDTYKVESFVCEKLYPEKDPKMRDRLTKAFIAHEGEGSRDGIQLQLFHDLRLREADEKGGLSFSFRGKYDSRACLVELFSYPKTVTSANEPFFRSVDNAAQARFIDALAFFPSPKIDVAIRRILHSTEDGNLARTCVRFLVGRRADQDIKMYVNLRRKSADDERRRELEGLWEMLGWTPLHVGAEIGKTDQIADLIAKGANVNTRATNGQTALHLAARFGQTKVVRLLLANGADPNCRDATNATPLHAAAYYCQRHSVLLLLAYKADRNAKTLNGHTPLYYAKMNIDEETVRLLEDSNAKEKK